MSKPIVVVGSLNADFVVRVGRLPERGETVGGEGFRMLPGGKGANQACAAGRMGAKARMVGRVGRDVFGERQRASLSEAGVDVSGVLGTEGEATGVALIFVEEGGQNMIAVAPGANARLSPGDVEGAAALFEPGGILLLQLETPLETVEASAALGRSRRMTTVLDPAPARPLSASLLGRVDLLTPNETEAHLLLGRAAREVSLSEADGLARELLKLGPGQVILKLGAKGAWWSDGRSGRHFPAPRVEAVDATAAGDTFNGALAAALGEGRPLEEAVPFANAAAAISVTRQGAQASIPARAEVDAFLAARP
jgi:ribokinase